MKNCLKVWMLGLVCVSVLFTGCDYGPLEEGEELVEYEAMEGALKGEGKKAEESKVGAWDFESDLIDADIAAVPADCACTCSRAAHKACRDLKDDNGKNLCPKNAHAVDIVGSCTQNGEACNGKCQCLDCYTPLGRKCGRLDKAVDGTCEWQF